MLLQRNTSKILVFKISYDFATEITFPVPKSIRKNT